jgi:hypothetical protein
VPPKKKKEGGVWGAENMAQVVEHLLCKCKALSSNSSPTKKKKKSQKEHLGAIPVGVRSPVIPGMVGSMK